MITIKLPYKSTKDSETSYAEFNLIVEKECGDYWNLQDYGLNGLDKDYFDNIIEQINDICFEDIKFCFAWKQIMIGCNMFSRFGFVIKRNEYDEFTLSFYHYDRAFSLEEKKILKSTFGSEIIFHLTNKLLDLVKKQEIENIKKRYEIKISKLKNDVLKIENDFNKCFTNN